MENLLIKTLLGGFTEQVFEPPNHRYYLNLSLLEIPPPSFNNSIQQHKYLSLSLGLNYYKFKTSTSYSNPLQELHNTIPKVLFNANYKSQQSLTKNKFYSLSYSIDISFHLSTTISNSLHLVSRSKIWILFSPQGSPLPQILRVGCCEGLQQ